MRLVTVKEIAALEKEANANGLGYDQMMRNAGRSLADAVMQRYISTSDKKVLGLVGSGNNGGDTLIALRLLQDTGWDTTAYLAKKRNSSDSLIQELEIAGGKILSVAEDFSLSELAKLAQSNNIILDGIFGTGFKLPLRGKIIEILGTVKTNKGNAKVVAVDCPSGVDCDSGKCSAETLKADITVCMAAVKTGLIKFPAVGSVGEIVLADIGLPEEIISQVDVGTKVAESSMISKILPLREANAHKGTFGTCMIVGGSIQYCGAPILAAKAAYSVGTGLVRTAIPGGIYHAIAGQVPESTWLMLPHTMGVINKDAAQVVLQNLGKAKVMLVGPGLGLEKETRSFISNLLKFEKIGDTSNSIGFTGQKAARVGIEIEQPIFVFDADALRILPEIKDWEKKLSKTAVLTPHPGEMAALTGLEIAKIQGNRLLGARNYARRVGHIIVLKGAVTIVASPDDEVTVIPVATSALATAGTGDVLAGMIAGLIAQGLDAYDAAVAGAWLHAVAGLFAEKSHGQSVSVIASDVIDQIPAVLKQITAL